MNGKRTEAFFLATAGVAFPQLNIPTMQVAAWQAGAIPPLVIPSDQAENKQLVGGLGEAAVTAAAFILSQKSDALPVDAGPEKNPMIGSIGSKRPGEDSFADSQPLSKK